MAEIIASLGWPHVSLIFAVIFILLFWKPIAGFISRATNIGKSGITAEKHSAPEAQREVAEKETVEELLNAVQRSIVLDDIESRIRNELVEKNLETDSDTARILIKHLAASRIASEFEQIYNFIFGSQIILLKRLNEVAGQGASEQDAAEFYGQWQDVYKDQLGDWSLDDYLTFLKNRALITLENGRYHITNLVRK
jgi:hypothetical protein